MRSRYEMPKCVCSQSEARPEQIPKNICSIQRSMLFIVYNLLFTAILIFQSKFQAIEILSYSRFESSKGQEKSTAASTQLILKMSVKVKEAKKGQSVDFYKGRQQRLLNTHTRVGQKVNKFFEMIKQINKQKCTMPRKNMNIPYSISFGTFWVLIGHLFQAQ